MPAAELRPCTLGLLDVLEQLPRDVCRTNVWLRLLEVPTHPNPVRRHLSTVGRAFRLTSRRSLLVADGWTERLRLLLSEPDEVPVHGAFLARQTGLGHLSLELADDDDSEALIIDTLRAGGAASHHLRVLEVDGDCLDVRVATGQAVRLCCPNLRELTLSVLEVHGDFFRPFYDCDHLMKLEVGSFDGMLPCGHILRALAPLPHLSALALSGTLDAAQLPLLSHLSGLRDLCLESLTLRVDPGDGPSLGKVLGGMPRLTRLTLPRCEDKETELACGCAQVAMVAELRALHSLTSLGVGDIVSGLTSGAFAALCRLTALTRLTCPTVSSSGSSSSSSRSAAAVPGAAGAGGGRLSQLRHLTLTGKLRSSDLAETLRRLAPLPHLREFNCALYLDSGPQEGRGAEADAEERAGGDCAGARAAADAWQAAMVLARAPRLQHLSLGLGCHGAEGGDSGAAGVATAALSPLLRRLTALRLVDLPPGLLEVVWPVLSLGSRLASLHLMACWVTRSGLVSVAEHLPGLRRLGVCYCKGAVAATCVALAAARVQPLCVSWFPTLDDEHRQLFRLKARRGVLLAPAAE